MLLAHVKITAAKTWQKFT